jgi:fluoride ion exporter CrcB/FEX
MRLFWIYFGGACGTGARYHLSGWTLDTFGAAFPYGPLAVNLIGSFLLAACLLGWASGAWLIGLS